MIIEAIKGTTQDNVKVLDNVKMTIDEEATVFLLQSISENLYKKPERAILQELGSNAFDSHVRAGQKRPFEVTLPSALNPVLIIQDWGMGMSKLDIKKTFSKVGGSDKRETNAERGGYGLGSKSPLSITPSYSFITVKNGEKHTVAVIRDDDGIPDFKFVGYEQTDEPNGVTVCVPVRDINAMQEAAENLYITYPQNSVLINGRAPEYSLHNPKQFQRIGEYGWYALDEDAVSHFNEASGEILGVRYAITPDLDGGIVSRLDNAKRVFLSLPNGHVKVETSREGIRSVSQSREHITRVAKAWMKEFRSQAEKRLQASDRLDALLYHETLPKFLREELPLWQGEVIPQNDIPIFPVQKRELTDAEGNPNGKFEVLKGGDRSFIRPAFTARVAPSRTSTRYKATAVTDNNEKHPTPSKRGNLTIVYTLPDWYSKTVSDAERDIRDYERSLMRAGVEGGENEARYVTVASPEDFTPWFRELAQFVPIENIAETAMEERREARRAAAARRQRSDYVPRAQREKRGYNMLLPALSSSSERARLTFEATDNAALETYVLGTRVEVPEDATETQRAMLENERIGGGGKVAYVIPDSNDESTSAGRFITRLADRAAHPGRNAAVIAQMLMELLEMEGYRVIALRASQKLEDFLEDAPGAQTINEAVDAVLARCVERFTDEADSLALWVEEKSKRIMKSLEKRLGELNDPLFQVGRAQPTEGTMSFLKLLRRGGRVSWYMPDRDKYTDAVKSNVRILGLNEEQSEAVLSTHDHMTELELIGRYPLLTVVADDKKTLDHAIFYANAVHEQLHNGNVAE